MAILKNIFLRKNYCGTVATFWATLGKFWATFSFQHLVTLQSRVTSLL